MASGRATATRKAIYLLCSSTGIFNLSAAFSFKNDTLELNSISSIRCFVSFLPSLMQTQGILHSKIRRHKGQQTNFFDKDECLFSTGRLVLKLILIPLFSYNADADLQHMESNVKWNYVCKRFVDTTWQSEPILILHFLHFQWIWILKMEKLFGRQRSGAYFGQQKLVHIICINIYIILLQAWLSSYLREKVLNLQIDLV